VQTHWTADTNRTPPGAQASWFPVAGEGERDYADVWIPASAGIPARELSAVEPFDLSAAVPPDKVDLENVTVEQFTVSRRYARPLAQTRLEALESQAVASHVPGTARHVHVNLLMEGADSRAALVPVYVMAYLYRDRVYRFVVNGQTGRATGTAPVAAGKVLSVIGIVAIVILIIILLVSM
jgi:hypothetical protein